MIAAAAAAILGATTLWVLAPLLGWTRPEEAPDPRREEQEDLLAARREILASIKDLEMESQVGKLTPEDYEQTRERLSQEAVEVLRRLDERDSAPAGPHQPSGEDR